MTQPALRYLETYERLQSSLLRWYQSKPAAWSSGVAFAAERAIAVEVCSAVGGPLTAGEGLEILLFGWLE